MQSLQALPPLPEGGKHDIMAVSAPYDRVHRIRLQRTVRRRKVLQSFDYRIQLALHGHTNAAGLPHGIADLVVTTQQSLHFELGLHVR
jgi:hypothetical protein